MSGSICTSGTNVAPPSPLAARNVVYQSPGPSGAAKATKTVLPTTQAKGLRLNPERFVLTNTGVANESPPSVDLARRISSPPSDQTRYTSPLSSAIRSSSAWVTSPKFDSLASHVWPQSSDLL